MSPRRWRTDNRGHAAMASWGTPRVLELLAVRPEPRRQLGVRQPPHGEPRGPAVDGAFQISGQAHGAVEPLTFLEAGEGQLRATVGHDDAAVLPRAFGPDARVVRSDGDGRPVLFSKLRRQSQYGRLGGAVALTSIRVEEDDPEPVVGAVGDRFQRAAVELVHRRVIFLISQAQRPLAPRIISAEEARPEPQPLILYGVPPLYESPQPPYHIVVRPTSKVDVPPSPLDCRRHVRGLTFDLGAIHEQELRIKLAHGVDVARRRGDAHALDVDRVERGVARASLGAHFEQCYCVLFDECAVGLVL
ncbi:unnamed protein product [Pelagomonas calceolata]|uniref:Uncharacterized protein n=1 Tax=Pelagomonas calceolata TaxID=35677 RepID=A0A8J2SNS5_9STRA|nr:unnamed protein product [Pelagomonas calceolata]